jgi:hypothetical protein
MYILYVHSVYTFGLIWYLHWEDKRRLTQNGYLGVRVKQKTRQLTKETVEDKRQGSRDKTRQQTKYKAAETRQAKTELRQKGIKPLGQKGIMAKRPKGKRDTNLVGGVAGRYGKVKTCALLTCA